MKELEFQKLIKRAWLKFIVGVIISLIVILYAIKIIQADLLKHIVDEVDLHHQVLSGQVKNFDNEQSRLINMLTGNEDLKLFATQKSSSVEATKVFYNIVKAQKNIMQLRFIDINGLEKIRVDQDKGAHVSIAAEEKLQNKLDRYYVKEFLELSRGEVGHSEFDLNEEHGKVETPYNPTLRMAEGVYVDDKLVGIVVINFYMEDWIASIMSFKTVKLAIINQEGYFMMHDDKDWAWSAYSTPKKKAVNYSLIDTVPNFMQDKKPFYKLSESIIAKNINLFGTEALVTYKLEKPLNSFIIEKIMELVWILLISFFAILLPMFYLINRYIQLTNQNSVFLKNILDNMFDALIVIDKKAVIQHVNNTTEELFGYSTSELVGENIKVLVPEPHRSMHDGYVKNYKEEERTIIGKQRKIRGLHKDGREIPISVAVTKIRVNKIEYYIGTVRDMSQVEKLEEMAKEQEILLAHQSKLASMGEMIGAIAHQWRQPLNEISIRIQKLKYDYMQEKIDAAFLERFIEKNKTTIEFMSKTIDNFRNFFRVDKNKQNFFVKEAVEEVLDMINAQLKNHNIKVMLDAEEFSFYGLKTEFQQVILNILGNSKDAFVANDIQNPEIKITVTPHRVVIEDNAGGVPAEIINRVFEPYFTTKEQGKGTGMGLYMSKMIIEENMDGKIVMSNTEDGVLTSIEFKGKSHD